MDRNSTPSICEAWFIPNPKPDPDHDTWHRRGPALVVHALHLPVAPWELIEVERGARKVQGLTGIVCGCWQRLGQQLGARVRARPLRIPSFSACALQQLDPTAQVPGMCDHEGCRWALGVRTIRDADVHREEVGLQHSAMECRDNAMGC